MPSPRARRRRPPPPQFAIANVSLWGRPVGVVAEDGSGKITFEYHPEFRDSGLEISPLHLPLSQSGPISFTELMRKPAFGGLPGVLADSLPDAFGKAVIRLYFEKQGRPDAALSPVQRLLYVGSRTMGALEFSPPVDIDPGPAIDDALAIAKLVSEARRVIEGDTSVAVPEIMQVGASAGGARAKALILWNRERDTVRSGFATPAVGDEHWLIKFDGVSAGGIGGPELREDVRPSPWGRIEYAYSRMARTAGIAMAETHLLMERDFAHFMTKRFDREISTSNSNTNGIINRFHMHSLGGLVHVDFNDRGAYSYEDYFTTMRELGMGQQELEQAFRRMVFNVAAVNHDDHVKNFAFMMTPDGQWHLSPAFDVMFAHGSDWTRTHQMFVNGKDMDIDRKDLLAVGRAFDIRDGGASIIREVAGALDTWDDEASRAGVPDRERAHISSLILRF
jgi:serine/threonine-protein kinase HipA